MNLKVITDNNVRKTEYSDKQNVERLYKKACEYSGKRYDVPYIAAEYEDGSIALYYGYIHEGVTVSSDGHVYGVSIKVNPDGTERHKWYEKGNTSNIEDNNAILTGYVCDSDDVTLYWNKSKDVSKLMGFKEDFTAATYSNGVKLYETTYDVECNYITNLTKELTTKE